MNKPSKNQTGFVSRWNHLYMKIKKRFEIFWESFLIALAFNSGTEGYRNSDESQLLAEKLIEVNKTTTVHIDENDTTLETPKNNS